MTWAAWVSGALDKREMWNQMRMSPTDLADISGYTYTYLMNGTAPADNWTGLFRPGERSAAALYQLRCDDLFRRAHPRDSR